jgi:hypothetical protein
LCQSIGKYIDLFHFERATHPDFNQYTKIQFGLKFKLLLGLDSLIFHSKKAFHFYLSLLFKTYDKHLCYCRLQMNYWRNKSMITRSMTLFLGIIRKHSIYYFSQYNLFCMMASFIEIKAFTVVLLLLNCKIFHFILKLLLKRTNNILRWTF